MVRPFDAAILTEYAGVFARDPDIAMIDNRFFAQRIQGHLLFRDRRLPL